MKTFTKEELAVVLEKHRKWLNNEEGGERANLNHASLNHAFLNDASLNRASLNDASLNDASLIGASLIGASLNRASLNGASLDRASLNGASLDRASLNGASLDGASLNRASLNDASLDRASLIGASLNRASLNGAILTNARLNACLVCPEEGEFIAWKCGKDRTIIKLLIPADAQRMTSLVGRKCRTDKVLVLEIRDSAGNEIPKCGGWHNSDFIYRKGETAVPDSYDPDIRIECSHGIHFFITKQEAIDFGK